MKKKILLGALALTLIYSRSFADGGDRGISERVKQAFRQEFVNAEVVQWENAGQFVKARFRMNDQVLSAYFYPDGEFLAVTRNILSDQLPIHLFTLLKKEYARYWITDLFEVSAKGASYYYITLQCCDNELVLKSEGGESWEKYMTKRNNIY